MDSLPSEDPQKWISKVKLATWDSSSPCHWMESNTKDTTIFISLQEDDLRVTQSVTRSDVSRETKGKPHHHFLPHLSSEGIPKESSSVWSTLTHARCYCIGGYSGNCLSNRDWPINKSTIHCSRRRIRVQWPDSYWLPHINQRGTYWHWATHSPTVVIIRGVNT